MNWSVPFLRPREMNSLWVEPPCPPTASPSLLRLPASCFKLPVAFCSCSFVCSTMDTKACRGGLRGGPYFYHTDGRIIAAHRTRWHHASYIWTAILFFFYSCVFTCNTRPPASGSRRAKRCVHVRVVVAIKKKKNKSEYSFCEEPVQLFSFLLLWTYNA